MDDHLTLEQCAESQQKVEKADTLVKMVRQISEDKLLQYRRYLDAVRTYMRMRAERGERPAQVLGAAQGMWAHKLLDRLIDVADDPKRCLRETRRLEACIQQMKEEED